MTETIKAVGSFHDVDIKDCDATFPGPLTIIPTTDDDDKLDGVHLRIELGGRQVNIWLDTEAAEQVADRLNAAAADARTQDADARGDFARVGA
jgi:hypothetical protein